ncbi:MAG: hypothetical protein V4510_11420 [bacterium]
MRLLGMLLAAIVVAGCSATPPSTQLQVAGTTLTLQVEFWIDCMPSIPASPPSGHQWMGDMRLHPSEPSRPFPAGIRADTLTIRGPGWQATQNLETGRDTVNPSYQDYAIVAPAQLGNATCGQQPSGITAVAHVLANGSPAGSILDDDVGFMSAV